MGKVSNPCFKLGVIIAKLRRKNTMKLQSRIPPFAFLGLHWDECSCKFNQIHTHFPTSSFDTKTPATFQLWSNARQPPSHPNNTEREIYIKESIAYKCTSHSSNTYILTWRLLYLFQQALELVLKPLNQSTQSQSFKMNKLRIHRKLSCFLRWLDGWIRGTFICDASYSS